MLNQEDIALLRQLAKKYMGYATLPCQKQTKALWLALNRREMQKPMVLIDQMPWKELEDDSLRCTIKDPYWRSVENTLRRYLYKWEHLPVDMVLPPYIQLPCPFTPFQWEKSFGLDRQEKTLGETGKIMAHEYMDSLENEEDLEKLRPMTVRVDENRALHLEQAHQIFDGIAPIAENGISMHLGIWDWVSISRGVTECYMDLIDRPEHLHAIMRRLTDCTLDAIDQYSALSAFDTAGTICHCSHTFSDDLPSGGEPVAADRAWAFGMAQLFSSAAPEVTEEFELPYMQELFSRFGAVYYGCCERLDDRLELIDRLPNVRKVSCSPWSDREEFARKLNKKYIMSNKPNPALLAAPTFDEEAVRADLRRTMQAARENGLALEMLLKDISTVKNDPARLWRWAEIAAEETASF
ncbi:MAG: hypothetical protein IJN82_06260 [Clostridia bacterium]|nr:hypothetical protein [Clostridia bacterium]MBQ7090703.1 hypothetical protein [Clostridia bacterium]